MNALATVHNDRRIIADRKLYLGSVCGIQVIRCSRASDMLSDYRDQRMREESQQGSSGAQQNRNSRKPITPTSINRELALLRGCDAQLE